MMTAPNSTIAPLEIKCFAYVENDGYVYERVPERLREEINLAGRWIDSLRRHLLKPGCSTVTAYLRVLEDLRQRFTTSHPDQDFPIVTAEMITQLVADDFPTICVGGLTDVHPKGELWAMVLPHDPTKIHIWVDVLRAVSSPAASPTNRHQPYLSRHQLIHFQTTILLHEITHVFTKRFFNQKMTPSLDGTGRGESGWDFETAALGGVLSVEWEMDNIWDMFRVTKLVFEAADGRYLDFTSKRAHIITSQAFVSSLGTPTLARMPPTDQELDSVDRNQRGVIRARADGRDPIQPESRIDVIGLFANDDEIRAAGEGVYRASVARHCGRGRG